LVRKSVARTAGPSGVSRKQPSESQPSGPQPSPREVPHTTALETDDVRWRLLLCGASAREVLAKIVRDDPLHLRARIGQRLVERSLLLDADRVLLRTFAHVAHAAARYQGRPELSVWLCTHVDRALEDCLREDRATVAPSEALRLLATPLRLDPSAVAAACRAFNALDAESRAAFFAFVLKREVAWTAPVAPLAQARAARTAMEQLLAPLDGEPESPPARTANARSTTVHKGARRAR